MLRLLLFCILVYSCTLCIAPCQTSQLMFMHMLDHVQAESESDPRGASPREYGGPQASSVMDANIVVTNANPGASNHHP
jgi:hypothetical protein